MPSAFLVYEWHDTLRRHEINTFVLQGQGATIAAQELARDFCRSWAKFGDMGEAEVWDEPSAVSKLLKCYEVMRVRPDLKDKGS